MATSLDREIDAMQAALRMCRAEGMAVVRIKTDAWEVEGAFKEEPASEGEASNHELFVGSNIIPKNLNRNDPDAVEAYLEDCKERGMTAEDFES